MRLLPIPLALFVIFSGCGGGGGNPPARVQALRLLPDALDH